MKIITRYLLKEITISVLLIMLALIAMFSFFDLIQELEDLGRGDYGLGKVVLFVMLSAPGHIYEIMHVQPGAVCTQFGADYSKSKRHFTIRHHLFITKNRAGVYIAHFLYW